MKKLFILSLLFSFHVGASECHLQEDFYGSLPHFLGATGTLNFTSEGIKVVDRGQGLTTSKVGNETRYHYPGERSEVAIIRTDLDDKITTIITTAPRRFDCNIRVAWLKRNKIYQLTQCSVDGCRHFNQQICEYLNSEVVESKTLKPDSTYDLADFFLPIEQKVQQLSAPLMENKLTNIEIARLQKLSARPYGALIKNQEWVSFYAKNRNSLFEVIKLGNNLIKERDYCQKLIKAGEFYQEDLRPSRFIPVKEEN